MATTCVSEFPALHELEVVACIPEKGIPPRKEFVVPLLQLPPPKRRRKNRSERQNTPCFGVIKDRYLRRYKQNMTVKCISSLRRFTESFDILLSRERTRFQKVNGE